MTEHSYIFFYTYIVLILIKLQMNSLFGSEWKAKAEISMYQNQKKGARQYQHPVNIHQQFQSALESQFDVRLNETIKQKHKLFQLLIENESGDKKEIILFIYDYKNLKGRIISKRPKFYYKLSSIYKTPLSEYQATSFMFHRLFNILQVQNLFISVEYLHRADRVIIQLSRYESDIVNMCIGEARLAGTYWKPILKEKTQVQGQRQLDFFIFIKRIVNQIPQQSFAFQYQSQNAFSSNIFKILENPLNFIDLTESNGLFNIYDYFSEKQKASFRQNEENQTLQIQYLHQNTQNQNKILSVILYFYDYRTTTNIFSNSDIFFTLTQKTILKKPLKQVQLTNAFFKQFILLLDCNDTYLSLEVNSEHQEVIIQISKTKDQLLNKLKGRNRFETQYWSYALQRTLKFTQNRVYTFEKIVKIYEQFMNQSSIFGSWKASNNIINNIFDSLL